MIFLNVDVSDAVKAKIITKKEAEWLENLRIPYAASSELWYEKYRLERLFTDGIASGKLKPIERVLATVSRAKFYAQSDYISGGEIKSQVDGKIYDSKSQYYKSLKEGGYFINESPNKSPDKPTNSEITGRDVKNAIERLKHGNR